MVITVLLLFLLWCLTLSHPWLSLSCNLLYSLRSASLIQGTLDFYLSHLHPFLPFPFAPVPSILSFSFFLLFYTPLASGISAVELQKDWGDWCSPEHAAHVLREKRQGVYRKCGILTLCSIYVLCVIIQYVYIAIMAARYWLARVRNDCLVYE